MSTLNDLTVDLLNLLMAVNVLESGEFKGFQEVDDNMAKVAGFLTKYPGLEGIANDVLDRVLPGPGADMGLWASAIHWIGSRTPIRVLTNVFNSSPDLARDIVQLYWQASNHLPSKEHAQIAQELASLLPPHELLRVILEFKDPAMYLRFFPDAALLDENVKRSVLTNFENNLGNLRRPTFQTGRDLESEWNREMELRNLY